MSNYVQKSVSEDDYALSLPRLLTDYSLFLFTKHEFNTRHDDVHRKHLDSKLQAFEQCISFVSLGENFGMAL